MEFEQYKWTERGYRKLAGESGAPFLYHLRDKGKELLRLPTYLTGLFPGCLDECIDFLVDIVVVHTRIVHDRVVGTVLVEAEARWWAVTIVKCTGEKPRSRHHGISAAVSSWEK